MIRQLNSSSVVGHWAVHPAARTPLKTISHPMTEMASRILQVGPVGSKFLGPIVIDVPHVASLRSGVRETAILRCDSASEGKWVEHKQKALEDSLKVSH